MISDQSLLLSTTVLNDIVLNVKSEIRLFADDMNYQKSK